LFYGSGQTGHSLQLTLPPRVSAVSPDRAEIDAVSTENSPAGAVVFDLKNPKYFGFAMYIHPHSGLPLQSGVHFMQAWQDGRAPASGTAKCGVPLVATLLDAGHGDKSLAFYISAHDDEIGPGSRLLLDNTPLTAGAWHTFLFYLQPDTNEMTDTTGKVQLWFDGVQMIDWNGDWGCNVSSGEFLDRWDLRVGMYRTADGPIDQYLYTFWDNIGVASYRAGADPRPPVIR
jgi:hypothetical protein